MKREGSMHLVPAPAVRLMKSRVTSRPGNKVYNLEFFFPFSVSWSVHWWFRILDTNRLSPLPRTWNLFKIKVKMIRDLGTDEGITNVQQLEDHSFVQNPGWKGRVIVWDRVQRHDQGFDQQHKEASAGWFLLRFRPAENRSIVSVSTLQELCWMMNRPSVEHRWDNEQRHDRC